MTAPILPPLNGTQPADGPGVLWDDGGIPWCSTCCTRLVTGTVANNLHEVSTVRPSRVPACPMGCRPGGAA